MGAQAWPVPLRQIISIKKRTADQTKALIVNGT